MFRLYTKAPEDTWFEWFFSGWQEWGGEQPEEFFWLPTDQYSKAPIDLKPLEEKYIITKLKEKNKSSEPNYRTVVLNSYYGLQSREDTQKKIEIEIELVSILGSPNKVQVMIRCPTVNQLEVESCIYKNFKFASPMPTEYKEYILKKPRPGVEVYGEFCFD